MRIVDLYRTKYSKISGAWRILNKGIAALAGAPGFKFGPCVFEPGAVLLPSGLFRHDLKQVDGDRWRGKQWEFTYGGDAALRLQKHLGLGMQVHDELVFGVKTECLSEFQALALEEMRRRPLWAPHLPLEAEAGSGR
jgi:hypothetical protein